MTTLTFPLSRIEGHAQVVIEVEDGDVKSAHFKAMELRGFAHFLKDQPADQMPVIVTRICGVCSTAHHVASVKALEDAYGVEPPPLAKKIRELMMLGQMLQNQATSLFIFTMPDRLGLSIIFQEEVSQEVAKEKQGIAGRALKVRKAGTDLITLAGGQFIHPVKAVVGGVTSGIPKDDAAAMKKQLEDALPMARELFDFYWKSSETLHDRIGTWGDDRPACYIAATGKTKPDYYGDRMRLLIPDNENIIDFQSRDFRKHLDFEETDYSYSAMTTYKGNALRANSLARINIADSMGTPLADEYLSIFREIHGNPANGILLFDIARGIELVYSIERSIELLGEDLENGEPAVPHTETDGEGFGLVEAPRGPLVHRYKIKDGLIEDIEFIIPTVHNVHSIELALMTAAKRYISKEKVDMELERAVGRVVRAFDPCIACATH